MKKNILLIAALALLTLGFTSCEKKSEGLTKTTYYADIQLEGDDYMVIAKGSTFTDPGFTATMAGKDVTAEVAVTSDVDTSKSGVYYINYSMVNADGFPASVTRTVVVLDPKDAVEGFWACDPASYRTNANTGAVVAYGAPFEILILNNGDGTYNVDDMLAGWYCQRAGYGENYAMRATITIDDAGNISLEKSYVPGWQDGADKLENGKYDAAAQTISYDLTYAEYLIFTVSLSKEEVEL